MFCRLSPCCRTRTYLLHLSVVYLSCCVGCDPTAEHRVLLHLFVVFVCCCSGREFEIRGFHSRVAGYPSLLGCHAASLAENILVCLRIIVSLSSESHDPSKCGEIPNSTASHSKDWVHKLRICMYLCNLP